MGRLFTVSLEGMIYSCKYCGTHLALRQDFVSQFFISSRGVAYLLALFSKVVNVTMGELKYRTRTTTGSSDIVVIFCVGCGAMIGWTYECIHENDQKYYEGKSVLWRLEIEAARVGGMEVMQMMLEQ